MAEQNETKKKPPIIPPNFVTLVQLKERFQREQREKEERGKQERERREREERDKQEREHRESEEVEKRREKQEEEKENQSVRRREKGKPVNRRNSRSRGGDDRRYRRKETEELEVARENGVEEAENGGFKSYKKGSKIWKRKEKRGNQFASLEYEVIEGEGQATSDNRKPDQLEAATVYVVTASENAVEERGERLENKRKGFKSWKKKGKRKDKARAENEEVIGGGELVLPSQSVHKETVPSRRDSRRRGTPRHFGPKIEDESDGQLVEISEKFEDLSVEWRRCR